MAKILSLCPGCGLTLRSDSDALEIDFNASSACRELYYQLSYYTLSLQDKEFIHQLIVDTYAAQHFGNNVKPITITFALVGLFLVNEKDYTGKHVQQIHVQLAAKNKNWPDFSPREQKAQLTIKEVLESTENNKQNMIRSWCNDVWKIWKPEENKIIALLHQYLDY